MVLDAVSRGIRSIDKVSRATRLDKAQVESIANDLVSQRLIIRTEKKNFFGSRKEQIEINETGQKLLNAKKAELEKQAAQLQQWHADGNTAEMQNYMDANRTWIPMMIFSGMMNMMFFASMMSMMDMTLNPAESAFGGADTMTGPDYGGSQADAGNTGDYGGSDFGGDISF